MSTVTPSNTQYNGAISTRMYEVWSAKHVEAADRDERLLESTQQPDALVEYRHVECLCAIPALQREQHGQHPNREQKRCSPDDAIRSAVEMRATRSAWIVVRRAFACFLRREQSRFLNSRVLARARTHG